MTSEKVAERVEAYIRERFRVPADDAAFSRATNLWENGYVDSTGVVELIGHIELTFGIVLPEDVLFDPAFTSVDGIARIVFARMSGSGPCSGESATTSSGTSPT